MAKVPTFKSITEAFKLFGYRAPKTFARPKPIPRVTTINGLRLKPLNADTLALNDINIKINDCINSYSMKHFGFQLENEGISYLRKAITGKGNTEGIINRIEQLNNSQNSLILVHIICNPMGNSTFILDHLNEIENIFTRSVRRQIGPDFQTLIPNIKNEKILKDIAAAVKNPNNLETKISEIIYNLKPHNIAFGNEQVTADTSFLTHLLTGRQYYNEGGSVGFNRMVNALAEKSYRENGGLLYYQIAEGILTQKPELADICSRFQKYSDSIDGITGEHRIEKLKEFFKAYPQNMTLSTIVPDKNALILPDQTLEIFKLKHNL